MQAERRRHTQIRTRYVSIGHTALRNERSRRRIVVRITPKRNKDGREKDKRQHTQDARKKGDTMTISNIESTTHLTPKGDPIIVH